MVAGAFSVDSSIYFSTESPHVVFVLIGGLEAGSGHWKTTMRAFSMDKAGLRLHSSLRILRY
jgi:hypothetical protein